VEDFCQTKELHRQGFFVFGDVQGLGLALWRETLFSVARRPAVLLACIFWTSRLFAGEPRLVWLIG
jgi:hypothetical protein